MSSDAGSSDHDAKRRKIIQHSATNITTNQTNKREKQSTTYHYEENLHHYEESFSRNESASCYRQSTTVGNIEQNNASWYETYRARVVKNIGDVNRHYGTSEYDTHILEKRGK